MACRNFVGITICFYDWRTNFNSQVSFPFYFIMIACCTLFMTHVLHTQFVSLYLFICGSSEERVCSRLFPVLRLPAISIWISWIVNAKKKKSASHSHKQTQTHASGFRNIRSAVFLHLRISWISLKYFVLLLAKKPKWLSLPGQRKRKNNEKEQSASHSFRDQLADWLTDWLRSAT